MKMNTLYDRDFNLWVDQTVNLLQTGEFNQLDLEHLIEEIQDMGSNRKDALESNLIRVLQH
ncbi:MAG: DUF29 domain-containing protein, partial [Sphaerospermopsis kisseleviana]